VKRCIAILLVLGAVSAAAQQPGKPRRGAPAPRAKAAAPSGPAAWLAKAEAESRRGDDRAAIASVTQALRLAPNSTELLYRYAHLAMRLGSPAEAVRAMSAATRIESDYPDYLYLLGVAQLWVGDTDAATVPLRRAAELDPKRLQAHLGHAYALHALKRYDEALNALDKALAIDATNNEAQYLVADIAQLRGDQEKALSMAQRILARDPRHPGANLVRGMVLAQRGDYRGARAALETSVAADSKYPRTHYQLSRVYAQLGENERAAAERAAFDRSTREMNEQQREARRLLDFATSGPAKPKK
jgi:predicted Zn-dependent protease